MTGLNKPVGPNPTLIRHAEISIEAIKGDIQHTLGFFGKRYPSRLNNLKIALHGWKRILAERLTQK